MTLSSRDHRALIVLVAGLALAGILRFAFSGSSATASVSAPSDSV